MGAQGSRLPNDESRLRSYRQPARFIHLEHLRRLRGSEQVAAVCYRVRKRRIEFLLVETRGGRWTFPKGSAEPGLTHAQAAALEAFEEAGVHGRMENAAFTEYVRRKRAAGIEIVVKVHLCEVIWLDVPQEEGRKPTWFPADKARQKLQAKRANEHANQLARVLESALSRISEVARTQLV